MPSGAQLPLLPLLVAALFIQPLWALRETLEDFMRIASFAETAEHLNELKHTYLQQLEKSIALRYNASSSHAANQTVAEGISNAAEDILHKAEQIVSTHAASASAQGANTTTLGAVGLVCLVLFSACICVMCRKPAAKLPAGGRKKKLGPKATAESSSEDEFKRETPKAPVDDERTSAGTQRDSAAEAAAKAAKDAELVQEQNRCKVVSIEENAKQVAATVMKLPRGGGGMFSRAQERYVVAEPEKRDESSSWSRQLQFWKRGRLAYWKDLEAYRARQEPKGSIDLMSITKVSTPFENREQVIVKQKDDKAEDSYLILQFKDNKRAQAWREAFKELRGHLV